MTHDERRENHARFAAFNERWQSDPDRFKAELMEEAHRDNPRATDDELEEHWKYAKELFGF